MYFITQYFSNFIKIYFSVLSISFLEKWTKDISRHDYELNLVEYTSKWCTMFTARQYI